MKFIKQYKEALSMELREHRSSFLVYMVLRLLVILVLILQIFNQNWESRSLCPFNFTVIDRTKCCSNDI